jgi:CelD/BcsL family acetyltransferase involved in cellulose biosynthesis
MNIANEQFVADTPHMTAALIRGGIEAIDAFAQEWGALCDAGLYDEPFYRAEWVRAYVAAFAPRSQIVVATVRDAQKLVAVLPLIRDKGILGGLPARRLRSASNTHSCRFELVHDPAYAEEAVACLWQALLREPGWDVLELTDIPANGALMRLTNLAAGAGYCTHVAPSLTPPYLKLTDFKDRPEALVDRLDAKFRSNLRRRLRKLKGSGAVTLSQGNAADARLARFFELERGGWKGAALSAIASEGATRTFYEEVAQIGERLGALSLYALDVGGRTVAMYFGLRHRGRYYLLKTAYDESLRDCSPGQLLTREVLTDLIAHGCSEFDFLGGMTDWKRKWAPSTRELRDVHVFRGAAGRALHALRFRLLPAAAKALRRMRAAR